MERDIDARDVLEDLDRLFAEVQAAIDEGRRLVAEQRMKENPDA